MRNYIIYGVIVAVLLFIGTAGVYKQLFPSLIDQFNPTQEQLIENLNGQVIGLPYGQAWPFDPTQKVQVNVVSKKQVEQFIVVFANIQAQADVIPIKNKDDKEPKEKLPKKVWLSGVLKMHYEQVGNQWYLVHLEGIGMKAVPLD